MYKLKNVETGYAFSSETEPVYADGIWQVSRGTVFDETGKAYEVVPPPRTWSADTIRAGLTLTEKVKWDGDAVPEIKTAKIEFATPQELAYTTEILDLLVASAAISQESMDKIVS
jgi:hypothetical protein